MTGPVLLEVTGLETGSPEEMEHGVSGKGVEAIPSFLFISSGK
jgi:hypothetical protein